nr:MAG TPA: hypothetical protein [Caudoviricetes sp.]
MGGTCLVDSVTYYFFTHGWLSLTTRINFS